MSDRYRPRGRGQDRTRRLTRESSETWTTEERREHLIQQDREARRVRRQQESDLREAVLCVYIYNVSVTL